ncbi:MAG: glutamate-5-semialdehyde dehydrogenase [Clostridiales bacterium]|jgi:glutamate-5-semialdehyde dehydrogenase|nr:glutamate-5-semialdehyde dehydrogenase [Clostridiales bacterium]
MTNNDALLAAEKTHIDAVCARAKSASAALACTSLGDRNGMLTAIADGLLKRGDDILRANAKDLQAFTKDNASYRDRLTLTPARIAAIADGVRQLLRLPDPLGGVLAEWTVPKGLHIKKVAVPLGVIGIIYESRPNITVDTAVLALKSGNAVVLRGSKDAIESNRALVEVMQSALAAAGYDPAVIQLITATSRESAQYFMTCKAWVDVLIPRGGATLIRSVVENATIPVIESGTGNCHVFVEKTANPTYARAIAVTAKTSRPSTCNAEETLLLDTGLDPALALQIFEELDAAGVEIRGCAATRALFPKAKPATESDYYTEFSDKILAVKFVAGVREAIAHIHKYSTRHSEAIVTEDAAAADTFLSEVDAAAVYVNASTRFTDGFEYGFGAEIAISTQKLHARGPMGLEALTSYKYRIVGAGQTR